MKKVKVFVIIMLCFVLTGCNNEFAKQQYNSNDKIAESGDRYSKSMAVLNGNTGSVSFTCGKFDGRQTVWSDIYKEEKEIEFEISFTLDKGKAKLVHIDEDDNVTTIIECTPDAVVDQPTSYTLSVKKGKNRLKVVGYDCEELKLSIEVKQW